MTIHYHGTPITPYTRRELMAGRFFCVSWANPNDVKWVHANGQGVMLDCGAFTFWGRQAKPDWESYFAWVEPWFAYKTTWAVIPDVIAGSDEENDALIERWPFGQRGAPVWHMHEPISRLLKLSHKWERVCIGSSAEYRTVGSEKWHSRMIEAMNRLCGNGPSPTWLHMLRGMQASEWRYPFASVDSTDIARNHCGWTDEEMIKRAARWDSRQCPAVWTVGAEQQNLFGG